jgi:hypothetical protein
VRFERTVPTWETRSPRLKAQLDVAADAGNLRVRADGDTLRIRFDVEASTEHEAQRRGAFLVNSATPEPFGVIVGYSTD